MNEFDIALRVLATLPLPPGEDLPAGASVSSIDEAERALGLKFPEMLSNGWRREHPVMDTPIRLHLQLYRRGRSFGKNTRFRLQSWPRYRRSRQT